MSNVIIVGNPRPGSRTRAAAENLAAKLGLETPRVIELSELGAGLLGWGDSAVAEAVAATREAEVAIFASPTYKATYTGLLKLFLDQFDGGTGLNGVVAIPLMLGGAPNHALAGEQTLKPVLGEIGAITATPAVFQIDRAYEGDPALDAWVERWAPVVRAIVAGLR